MNTNTPFAEEKIIKVKEFKERYTGKYEDDSYTDLERWQKDNPQIKIIDTRITQKVYTNYDNYLLVTYEDSLQQEKEGEE